MVKIFKRTADKLIKYVKADEYPSDNATIIDYFGGHINLNKKIPNNSSINYINVILGVYRGMYLTDNLDSKELHKALLENKIDELIYYKYKLILELGYKESWYYKIFKELGIKLNSI
jgi:hypothetical protein